MSKSSATKIEKFALPTSTDGVCALVREVLSPDLDGSVTRIEVDVELGVRVSRQIKEVDLVEDDVTWDAALRNAPDFLEYHSEGASPFQVVFDMMHLLQAEGLLPVQWVAGFSEVDLVGQWLNLKERGLPTGVRRILGVPFQYLRSLPEDSIILCGSKYIDSQPEEMSLAVKAAIELDRETTHGNRDIPRSEDHGHVWPSPRERPAAVGGVATLAGGPQAVQWGPPSYPRK